MAYDPGAIDATLAAALGDEPALIAELRQAFLEGVREAIGDMKASDAPKAWRDAALRLKGLAASFGAVRLMALAEEAASGAVQNAALLRKIEQAVKRF
ncbi:Hpt domain-containing protein [Sphingomonas sp. RS6]